MTSFFCKAVSSGWARAAWAVGGVAASALLVLVLLATYRNLTSGVAAYTGQDRIDLWIAPAGTDNLIRSSALLPARLGDAISAMSGVSAVDPLLRSFVTVEPGGGQAAAAANPGARITLLSIGYRAPHGLGGPPRLVAGRAPKGEGEVTLDRAAAHRLGVGMGDFISINGRSAEVVGLSGGTNLMATQFVFLDAAGAGRLSGFAEQVSFLAVRLRTEAPPPEVARRIGERFPQVAVHIREDFVENNVREVAAGFRPMQLLVSLVGVLAAAVLVALLVHGVVEDRRRDIAVLLAMGARGRAVAQAVMLHTLLLIVLGSCLGAIATCGLRAALDRWLPTVELASQPVDVALVALLFGAVGVLASAIPLLRLRRIDPIEAFSP